MTSTPEFDVSMETLDSETLALTVADISENQSPVEVAVTLLKMHHEILVTRSGSAYAIKKSGPRVALPLDSKSKALVDPLARDMHRYKKRGTSDTIELAMSICRADAERLDVLDLPVRAHEDSEALYIDIGDETGDVIAVTASGWQILSHSPVLFARTELTAPLPRPERDGDITRVFEMVNLADADQDLFIGCLVAAFNISTPRPLLILRGGQGSGKTQNAKVFVSLTDPSTSPVRSLATKIRDWEAMLPKSSVLAIDNVSRISQDMSDAMCRASTGGSAVVRALYTDSHATVSTAMVMQVITTIALETIPDDLMDRSVLFAVPNIAGTERATSATLMSKHEALRAEIFGALLDLLVEVRRVRESIALEDLPRMADFAVTLAAVDEVRGTSSLARYRATSEDLVKDVVADHPLLQAILASGKQYEGTVSAILKEAQDFAEGAGCESSERFEGLGRLESREVGSELPKIAPSLQKLGWVAECLGRNNADHMNRWRIRPPGVAPSVE